MVCSAHPGEGEHHSIIHSTEGGMLPISSCSGLTDSSQEYETMVHLLAVCVSKVYVVLGT